MERGLRSGSRKEQLLLLCATALLLWGPLVGLSTSGNEPPDSGPFQRTVPKLDVSFTPNAGLLPPTVLFHGRCGSQAFFLREDGIVTAFSIPAGRNETQSLSPTGKAEQPNAPMRQLAVALEFLNANPHPVLEPRRPTSSRINYLTGRAPGDWVTDLSSYREVTYREIWPGIDVVITGENERLKYQFDLGPGSDPSQIRLRYQGADELRIDGEGNLLLKTAAGILIDPRPASYQDIGGRIVSVESRFILAKAESKGSSFGIAVDNYDPGLPLHIDPGLVFSTYLGGTDSEMTGDQNGYANLAITVGRSGQIYLAGETRSPDYPTTLGVLEPLPQGNLDAFVAQVDSNTHELIFATYLGGSGNDSATAISMDASGRIVVGGTTSSTDFPTTPDSLSPSLKGLTDTFIARLEADGSTLVYSTYLGGTDSDTLRDLQVDHADSLYVTGYTQSSDLPTTPGAFKAQHWASHEEDGFVAKLDHEGTLLYLTYLGGQGPATDRVLSIALDAEGAVVVTGVTTDPGFPVTSGAFATTSAGAAETFVARLNADGTELTESTFLGGSGDDHAFDLVVGDSGEIWLAGITTSQNLPTTTNGVSAVYSGGETDLFLGCLTRDLSSVTFLSYLGGSGRDGDIQTGPSLALDSQGTIHLTGGTASFDFPATPDAFSPNLNSLEAMDSWYLRLHPEAGLLFATYLGGFASDASHAIAVDRRGNAFLAGVTSSPDFPLVNPIQSTLEGGTSDLFLVEFSNPIGSAVLLAEESIHLKEGSQVLSGDLVVNEVAKADLELQLEPGVTTPADFEVRANRIKVKPGALISGPVFFNELDDGETLTGERFTPLNLPIFDLLPPFSTGLSGTEDVVVTKNKTLILAPGDYRDIQVEKSGVLVVPGGIYNLRSVILKHKARIDFEGPTEICIGQDLQAETGAYLGPIEGSKTRPSEIILYIAGDNSKPLSQIDDDSSLRVNIYAPGSQLKFGKNTVAEGAFIAREIIVNSNCRLSLDSYFATLLPEENRPPITANDSGTTLEDQSVLLNVLANDTEPDGDNLKLVGFTQAQNGVVSFGAQDQLVYTPRGNFNGSDTFTYTAGDERGGSAAAAVTLIVHPVNDPPGAADDLVSTEEDTSVPIGVLENDTDVDGDPLTIISFTQPTHGSVAEESGGVLIYTPEPDFNGTDNFGYSISDGSGATATAGVTVSVKAVNDSPFLTLSADRLEGMAPLIIVFTATAHDADLDPLTFLWDFGDGTSRSGSVVEAHAYQNSGDYSAVVTASDGLETVQAGLTISVSSALPPDPTVVAPSLDRTQTTTLDIASQFLYTGSNPIQTGVAEGTIEATRAAVVRGRALDRQNRALSGVTITILNHPELGQTLSRHDGWYDLVVNGGGNVTVNYAKTGYITVQRQAHVPWHEFAVIPSVVLIEPDNVSTTIDLDAETIQVARASTVSDDHGIRRATLLFPPGTHAEMVMPDGSAHPANLLEVRATEFTVGENGPQSMPAELPPSSAYTYCVALTVDEAVAAGATQVRFNQRVPLYVENFLGFPAGIDVPLGYYGPSQGQWVASDSGRVISILSVSGGLAELDVEGSGLAAEGEALAALGISQAERQKLTELYPPGQSLWRVLIPHFSSWDLNWGVSPPADAAAALVKEIRKWFLGEPCLTAGSQIECQNQILGELVPIAGTPYTLNYRSDRVGGANFANTIGVKVSGDTVPASLKRIDVEFAVGGKLVHQSFAPSTGQTASFTWDGLDVYGRRLQGRTPAMVRVGYVYDGVYTATERFGYQGNGELITAGQTRSELVFWNTHRTSVGSWQARAEGLGGWTMEPHHRFDVVGRTLYFGDGRRRRAEDLALITDTVAKMGTQTIGDPHEVETGPDGSLYVPDGNGNLRRISPEGEYFTVASGLGGANDVALAANGTLYVSDSWTHRVWKIHPDGTVEVAAGNGTFGYSGDGGSAIVAQLASPKGITVGPEGTLHIADSNNHVVRRVTPDGLISTLAGTGKFGDSGDGGPASSALLRSPSDVALGQDGSVYVVDNAAGKVRRVGVDGIINTVAGNGLSSGGFEEGVPAVKTRLFSPGGIVIDREGNLLITEYSYYHGNLVRIVDSAGTIRRFAGKWPPSGDLEADGLPALQTLLRTCKGLGIGADGTVFLAVSGGLRSVHPALPGYSLNDLTIASEDGSELYQFEPTGRHLRTLNTLTGAVLNEFIYNSAGLLTAIIDGDGNQTVIERDGPGNPTALVAPFGQRTILTLNENGYLATLTNPASGLIAMTYTPDGLLQSFTDARTNRSSFEFDLQGRLTKDTDAANGHQALFRTDLDNGYEVLRSTALGRNTTYRVEELDSAKRRHVTTFPSGTQNESIKGDDETRRDNFANGTQVGMTLGPDPRFGMLVPLVETITQTTPSGLTSTMTTQRFSDLADPDDPLSLLSQTEISTINGSDFTSTFNSADLEFISTSAEGRETRSRFDSQGRILEGRVTGLLPVQFSRDSFGRLIEITQGDGGEERLTRLVYNPEGFVESATDPAGRTTAFEYDPVGRVTSQTLPDGRSLKFSYDANGNVVAITPPGRPPHIFSYSAVDLEEQYDPPPIESEPNSSRYDYNLDRQLTQVLRPDGQAVTYEYDTAGRMSRLAFPRGSIEPGYDKTTGQLSSLTAPGGTLSFAYDGHLPTQETWTGEVSGSVEWAYDSNFRVKSESVNGADTVSYVCDNDSLLLAVGDLMLGRDPQNGLHAGSTLGSVSDFRSYNGFAEPTDYTATFNGSTVYAVQFTYDRLGRISSKTETIGGVTNSYAYIYDLAGRLTEVREEGVTVSSYEYDSNNNRTTANTWAGTGSARYDDQDRLLEYGGTTYSYTEDGGLLSKTIDGLTTSYDYDVLGNLRSVTLPDNTQIEYLIDARNRRIGKKVNGTPGQGFLYSSQLNPVAELDGSGNLVTRFVYANRPSGPDYMVKDGTTYRIISDHLGSPRLVINITTGIIAQRIDYDEFGNVRLDTNPGFQPFGFAGGLYEGDTALVRFGARDYDPAVGRWTTKDPIRFAGGDSNLYGYVLNDPVNLVDPFGRFGDGFTRGGDFLGHSDFHGSDRFDYVKEDYGWTNPWLYPVSTWRHFRSINSVEVDLKRVVCSRDAEGFESYMHQGQDYFSHFEKGYRASNPNFNYRGWPLPGHVIAGHAPDRDEQAWTRAEQWTKQWVKRWDDPTLCGCN